MFLFDNLVIQYLKCSNYFFFNIHNFEVHHVLYFSVFSVVNNFKSPFLKLHILGCFTINNSNCFRDFPVYCDIICYVLYNYILFICSHLVFFYNSNSSNINVFIFLISGNDCVQFAASVDGQWNNSLLPAPWSGIYVNWLHIIHVL